MYVKKSYSYLQNHTYNFAHLYLSFTHSRCKLINLTGHKNAYVDDRTIWFLNLIDCLHSCLKALSTLLT